MAKLVYDKGFSNNIIGEHDTLIKNIILSQLNDDDLFINTTWLEITDELKHLLGLSPNRVICYSGPDWENTVCRKDAHEYLKQYNPIHVGNTYGEYYFSFWLDFVYKNLKKYETFDPYNISKLRPFMCLNRKPHPHRVELIKEIDHLLAHGLVSLGITPPLTLNNDIINIEGDSAVVGNLGITNDITSLGNPINWNSHFLNVVTETTIHTNVFLSEKVFKPIIGRRPFIILGDDQIYNVLHSWGIDTFDDLFGIGYKEKWHTNRIQWIKQVLENLVKEKNLGSLLLSLKPRLEKNYQALLEAAKKNKTVIERIL